MMNKKYLTFGICLIMTLLLTNGVYALAVSSPYWNDNPLKLSPGDSMNFQLVLKNSAGTLPANVGAEITEGKDIAKIVDSTAVYNAPAGGEAVVNVRVDIPSDAPIGKSYSVKFSFKTIGSSQGGTVGIEAGIDTSLPVLVVEKVKAPETSSNMTLYLVIAIVILVAVIALVMRRKK